MTVVSDYYKNTPAVLYQLSLYVGTCGSMYIYVEATDEPPVLSLRSCATCYFETRSLIGARALLIRAAWLAGIP